MVQDIRSLKRLFFDKEYGMGRKCSTYRRRRMHTRNDVKILEGEIRVGEGLGNSIILKWV